MRAGLAPLSAQLGRRVVCGGILSRGMLMNVLLFKDTKRRASSKISSSSDALGADSPLRLGCENNMKSDAFCVVVTMQFYAESYRDVVGVLSTGRNRDDPYAVRRACLEFARLVIHRNELRHQIVQHGELLPFLAEVTATHVDAQPEVIMDACRFLRRLISLREPTELDIQSKITEAKWLPILTQALVKHASNSRLFIEVCRLVALLCFDMPAAPHADNQDDIRHTRLLDAILARMKGGTLSAEEAVASCEAIRSILYENGDNVSEAVENLELMGSLLSILLEFNNHPYIVQTICQVLFQVVTLRPISVRDVVACGLIRGIVRFLESSEWTRFPLKSDEKMLLLWHVSKFVEVSVRHGDDAKDAFCDEGGVAAIIAAIKRATVTRDVSNQVVCDGRSALPYVVCMLFCRLATTAGSPTVIHSDRLTNLVQGGAHQYALEVIQNASKSIDQGSSTLLRAVEQAVRLLEAVASVDLNRVALTRLGASRHVKVVYNSVDVTAQPGLLVLCERAVAAIEGT